MSNLAEACVFNAENLSAEKVVARVRHLLGAMPRGIRNEPHVYVGSAEYLAKFFTGNPGPAIYATWLGNIVATFRGSPVGGISCLSCLLQRLVSRQARNSVLPISRDALSRMEHRFSLESPLQTMIMATLVVEAICAEIPAPPQAFAAELRWFDLEGSRSGVESIVPGQICEHAVNTTEPIPREADVRGDVSPSRHVSLDSIGGAVLQRGTPPCVGLVDPPSSDLDAPIPSCSVKLRLEGVPEIITLGRSSTYQRAGFVAALEAMERYAGLTSAHYSEGWTGRLAEIDGDKLDPRRAGLHLASSYAAPGFPYPQFHNGIELDWVWSRNLTRGGHTAVPACLAYYGGTARLPQVRLAYDTSNGCALGTSMEEASLHAVLELVERDAFMMVWYGRRELPDITAVLSRQDQVRWTLRKIELVTGMEVRILDSTMEHGIPSVICVAAAHGESEPATVFSAGCALTHADAALSAMAELSGHCLFLKQRFRDPQTQQQARAMYEDDNLVMTMEDHGYVNALPQSRSRFEFLLRDGAKTTDLSHVEMANPEPRSVRESLERLVKRLAVCGLDVLVVEHAIPLLRVQGLVAVKAIVPGLLPMTFGHVNRRLNLPRVGNAEQQQLAAAMAPHPFM